MPIFIERQKGRFLLSNIFGITEFFIFGIIEVFCGTKPYANFQRESPGDIMRYNAFYPDTLKL